MNTTEYQIALLFALLNITNDTDIKVAINSSPELTEKFKSLGVTEAQTRIGLEEFLHEVADKFLGD